MNNLNNIGLSIHSNWQYLFAPNSVAVIGASNTPGSWGFGIMRHLLASSKRNIYPVNPTVSQVLGVPAYDSVVDIPSSIDLAVIVVSAPQVSMVFRECVQKGVKAVAIISSGFAETGEPGLELETELVKIAKQGGIRFIGPNSMGHVDTSSGLSTLAWTEEITPGPVGLISQSGSYGARIIQNALSTGIGFSKFVSTGNEADLHLEDYLEYLTHDENTKIITAYIEGLREGKRFFQLAKETATRKPIIVIKAGGTKESARAARSHTGTLAGSEAVYAAAFRQAGVIKVDDDDELVDVVTALLNQPLPQNNRIGILTLWGGLGVVAAEACEREGLEIALLASSTMEKLNAIIPVQWSNGNPIDVGVVGWDRSSITLSALRALMEDKNVDAILLQLPFVDSTSPLSKVFNAEEIRALRETEEENLSMVRQQIKEYRKPVFMVKLTLQCATDPDTSSLLHRKGIPAYPNPRRAARVLHDLVWYRHYLDATKK